MAHDAAHWMTQLSSDDVILQTDAAEELAKLGEDAKLAAPNLARLAGSEDEKLREWVVAALESLGTPRVEDLQEFRELALTDSDETAYWGVTLLGRLETDAASAVPDLVSVLKNSSYRHNRERAAWALGKIGPAAFAAVAELKHAAHSPDARLARIALMAIQQITDPE